MTQLSDRYAEAVGFAITAHDEQLRKGTKVTYVSHLLAVSALVLEHGGDEDLAIAGLLHDAVEDTGDGEKTAERIGEQFGDRVVEIVLGCSDTEVIPKPPWRERKERYIADLIDASDDVLLVSACDKLHNARSTVADLREHGVAFLEGATGATFHAGPADQVWYYQSLLWVFRRRFADDPSRLRLLGELERTITELVTMVGEPEPEWPPDWRSAAGPPCPACGEPGRPIVWGMPSSELMEAVEAGLIDVELGGCCVSDDDPTHTCRACGHQFRQIAPVSR